MFRKACKFSIILNYHRIGYIDPKNPLHRLHTVSLTTFKWQIKICSLIGKFVSLDDIINSNLNSRLSFSITFDDVSYSNYDALMWLDKRSTPFAICPCQQITEENLGWRDKVYFIEKFLDNKEAVNAITAQFPMINFDINDDFYSLSKSSKFDQIKMLTDVVNPLYKKVCLTNRELKIKKNYFSPEDLINLKNKVQSVEIVNHSFSHANLTHFNVDQLTTEIAKCDKFLKDLLGQTPKYFAVPFGGFESSFAVGLCEVARLHNKQAILWVANLLNLDIGSKPNKIKQLSRFHTSVSVLGLCKQIIASFLRPHFMDYITRLDSTDATESNIVFNPNSSKILAFEDLSRPIKDYSGNLDFLNNVYIKNPFLHGGNHTIAEIQNDRIVSIGQNLILPFSGLGDDRFVNFFGNWRTVAGASKMGAAAILGKAVREYKLTISYKPSVIIEPSLIKMGWYSLPLKRFTSYLHKTKLHTITSKLVVSHNLDQLCELDQFNCQRTDTLQLKLSKELINWKVEKYSLATPVYFMWNNDNGERAFVVGQFNDKEILLLDQRFSSPEALGEITKQILQWSINQGLYKLSAETSCIQTQGVLTKALPKLSVAEQFCYFAPRGVFRKLAEKIIIITPLSSDIMLR